MPDREKTVEELKELRSYFRAMAGIASSEQGQANHIESARMIEDAIILLKSLEPVKPLPGLWDRDIPLFSCGGCGGEIGAKGISKYCSHCGRKVKWDA